MQIFLLFTFDLSVTIKLIITMIRALWLTSWYPNRLDTQNGDFIQRHAKAASLYCKVDVIHIEPDKENKLTQPTERNCKTEGNLSETIVLYKLSNIPFLGKIISWLRYIQIFKKEILCYIKNNGLPNVVHVHVPVKAGLLALWLKRKYKISFIITEHWNIYKSPAKDEFGKRNFLFRYYSKKIFRAAALFLPVSNDLGRRVCETVGDVKYEAVPNCADVNIFYLKEDIKAEEFTFIHASTFNYPKNPEAILKSFIVFNKKNPSTRLLMLGEIPQQLQEFISKENISSYKKIIFTGLVPYSEVAKKMQQSHTLLMYSRYENLPCVVLEALCCGLPVISSAVGGIPEIVAEKNGILLNKYSEECLVNEMENMFVNYSKFNQQKISMDAADKFSYPSVGKMIVSKYEKLMEA